jgi:cell division protein FtsQ
MPPTGLKKFLSRLLRRGKHSTTGLRSDLTLRVVPLPGGSGQVRSRHPRLVRLKRLFLAKKNKAHEGYSRPVVRKRPIVRAGVMVAILSVLGLAIVFGGKAKLAEALHSIAWFKINKIDVVGCTAVARDKLVEASGIVLYQTSLLALNSSQIEAKIAAVPWVARVEVTKDWPSRIAITIEENAPFALLHSPDTEGMQLQYIDAKGVPFASVPLGADIDFPVITGLAEITDPELREKALAEALLFLRKVHGNDPHLPAQSVSELHFTKAGEMVVYHVDYPFPIFFGNGNTKQKYSRLIQVLRALFKKEKGKELLSQIKYIQMDYMNDKVIVVENGSG